MNKKIFLLLFIALFLVGTSLSSSTGYNNPSSAQSIGEVGICIPWGTPTNVYSSNNQYSTAVLTFDLPNSCVLAATGFSFSIPTDATINGIVVQIERKASLANKIKLDTLYLTKDGTNSVGSDGKDSSYWTTTDTYSTHGGISNLWGTTWTPTEINSANFGVLITAYNYDLLTTRTAYIDHIRINVTYTEAAPSGTPCDVPANNTNWTLPCNCTIKSQTWTGDKLIFNNTGNNITTIDTSNIQATQIYIPDGCSVFLNGTTSTLTRKG